MTRSRKIPRSRGRNCLALAVVGLWLGVIQLSMDPGNVGGSPMARAASNGPPRVVVPPSPPLPIPHESGARRGQPATAPGATAVSQDDPQVLRGIWALKMSASLLEKGCQSFARIPDYTATMYKQERIGGHLGEGQSIELKMRHEPFSVYMKWSTGDRGRQLIYVRGENDGNLLVQPGGIKGRLTGVLSLDPTGAMAMSESRHPITQAGLLELARTVLTYQQADIKRGSGFQCELRDDQMFENRRCYLYTVLYDSPEVHKEYRKSLLFIDKELSMPICVKNFTWARDADPQSLDDETLIEFYAYTDLRLNQQLQTADFDQHNQDYKLRVKR